MTRYVEPEGLCLSGPVPEQPEAGDLVVARVLHLGRSVRLEDRRARKVMLFPFDRFVCALGNRYATDHIEAYARLRGELADILSVGGLLDDLLAVR